MLPNIGTTELIIIVIIALLIFGPSKIPDLGKALGRGIKEFKKATTDIKTEVFENQTEDNKK